MRLSTFIVPVASILGLACAQIGAINTAIADIRSDVDAVKNAFNAGTAAGITSSITELDDSISAATTVVTNSPAVGLLDALSLASAIGGLQTSIDQAFTVVKAKRTAIDALGLTGAVRTSLIGQKSAVDVLGGKVISKVPSIVQGTAKSFVAQLDASYAAAIAAYS
ncbi:hypothetical protein MCOR11_011714 [Pyricularia oryzae]|uniref:Uncharacterized protein n=1 Tax=Pyricularia grisea TaxID=148305 RepID=A0ABQ8N5H3_PYRGI|nr:hypothetical protein MCOR33_010724 [Pyricularia grisea]KAI6479994.1 hypothetical protein MCOR11_011714 [Pyricularia oryzae]KAI6512849.1 hypothetical protein MCOR10_009548 [Pyricularia oryzae]